MGRIILVTGGSRSGKSAFAQRTAEELPSPRVFVATCPLVDDEMKDRIRRHQEARSAADWLTVEEEIDLARVIGDHPNAGVFLVDCLTLWVSNLMFRAQSCGATVSEEDVTLAAEDITEACSRVSGTVIFVTNELGSGIVPMDPVSRRYRDLVGRLNQVMAAAADKVALVACGIPLTLKETHRV